MTVTAVPAGPVVGDSVTCGVTGVVTVKVVVALTVAPVNALIVWDPAADGDGTEKTAENDPAPLVLAGEGVVVR